MVAEEPAAKEERGGPLRLGDPSSAVRLADAPVDDVARLQTGIGEFDRVLGGGLVEGGVVLLGGEPGAGKSTLVLQAADRLSRAGHVVVYVSAEESAHQVRLRANRLGISGDGVLLVTDNGLPGAFARARTTGAACVVIDSIQAVTCPDVDAAPGSILQARECTALAVAVAKSTGIAVLITGHVTKEGNLAGPKTLEHMVDTVLYFEGEYRHAYRVVRATKNRFGSTDEIGVFEMRDGGLEEVANPSALCLSDRKEPLAGCAVVAGIQGSRPLLVEVQALVASSQYGAPRRVVSGVEAQRLALALAVLERRTGLGVSANDVFVSAAGGMRLSEPAADLGISVAVASATTGKIVPLGWCMIGEVALTGEVRPVAHLRQRVAEAARMGFTRVMVPAHNLGAHGLRDEGSIEVVPVETIARAMALCLREGNGGAVAPPLAGSATGAVNP